MTDARGPGLAAHRHELIRNEARLRGFVKVAELARRLGVSEVTVRRDITALVDAGDLARVHGGATLPAPGAGGGPRRPLATLGMVLPASRYYYRGVVAGAEEAAARVGMRLVLAVSRYDVAEEARLVERMLRAGVDALLVATARPPHDEPPRWFASAGVPVVLVERRADGPDAEYARTDHAAGARLAVEHLADLGHERVGLAVRPTTPTSSWLVDGFREATRTRGTAVAGFPPVGLAIEADGIAERDRRLADLLRRCAETGTRALLVHADEDAVSLLDLATDQGVRVPEDLSIVAYDDEMAALAPVPLTAVAPPKHDVGRAAVDLAVRRLSLGPAAATQQVTLLPRLVVRASTAAP
ncbi:substrate-binding domain-containing protein [Isoptericola sp. NPDC055881]